MCGFEKEAGLVISDTTCGGRPSAGNMIASKDCIKSMVLGSKDYQSATAIQSEKKKLIWLTSKSNE